MGRKRIGLSRPNLPVPSGRVGKSGGLEAPGPKKGPAGGTPAPGPPGGPGAQKKDNLGQPWDLAYQNAVNAANTRFQNQQLDYGTRRTLAEQDFGLGAYADAAVNPYSRAALLRQSYDQSVKGTRNRAGRQIFSGSYELAQRGNERNYAKASDQLRREYESAMADITREEVDDRGQAERDIEGAGFSLLGREAKEEIEPQPVPPGGRKRRQRRNQVRNAVNRNRGRR